MRNWYQIKARYMNFYPPNGMVIKFWLYQENEADVRKLIIKKGYTDLEWIRKETPPFIGG